MKRLFGIVILLLALVPCIRADGPDDQYVQIYNLIQEGDSFGPAQANQAVVKYTEAQTALRKFQKIYPAWNERVVNFRLDYLASKITILSANTARPTNAPVAITAPPAVKTEPAPVPVPQPVVQTPPPTVQTPPPVVQTPPPVSPVVAPQPTGPSAAELQSQITDLQNQLRQLQIDKSFVEAKLREALAARPAGADPREFAEAQNKIRSMEKENALLQVSLAQEREKVASLANSRELEQTKLELVETKRQLAEQTARTTQLAQQNESLQEQIKTLSGGNKVAAVKLPSDTTAASPELSRQLAQAKTTIAALEADKEVWSLEKIALQNRVKQLETTTSAPSAPLWTQDTQHIKQLERERDDLQKKLDAAQKELYGRNGKTAAARVDELANQLETLRARLNIFESKPVPYTPEELALFKKPEKVVVDPHAGERSARELPAGTVQLVSQAQQDFSAGSFQQAEQKYLEVLRQDGKNVNTLANLATIQLEMGHMEDAEKNLKAALAVAPDDSFSLSILGNLKFRQAKYDEALDALSRAAKTDPKNPEIQNFLGLTLSEKGMRSAAETAFRKAVLLNPNYGGAQNNLAVFYLTQQPPSLELARWHYDKAVASGFPRNPEMEKALDAKKPAE